MAARGLYFCFLFSLHLLPQVLLVDLEDLSVDLGAEVFEVLDERQVFEDGLDLGAGRLVYRQLRLHVS